MSDNGDAGPESGLEQIRDFIFSRELAEVYLLLDHVSGRSDKALPTATANADGSTGKGWIEEICEIGWPPKGTIVEQAKQAAILLKAKDRLNAAAYPASGATVAFTLLVAGEDNTIKRERERASPTRNWLQRLAARIAGDAPAQRPEEGPVETAARVASPPGGGGNGRGGESGGGGRGSGGGGGGGISGLGSHAPSRTSLAQTAYPGLVRTAARFNWQIKIIIALLFVWLGFTCALSWNITAGHAILTRLDAVVAQRNEIKKKINDIESEEAKQAAQPRAASQAPQAEPVLRYCDRSRKLEPVMVRGQAIPQFNTVTEHQVCDQLASIERQRAVGQEDLADWLAIWRWLKGVSHVICRGKCLESDITPAPSAGALNEQWASILIEVLSSAVLPLCYGFLGAGAAVVRNLWGKMRDSLLSPRDLTLSLGQLALGAVIGASIGLFIAPSGAGSQGAVSLTGTTTLSASALSFIAGFGVEGVFVALESLIKRVFNISEPGTPRST